LASAYGKLGDVQGKPVEGNAGDSKAALASYRKALALQESAGDETSSNPKTKAAYLATMINAANTEDASGDPAEALRLNERAVVLGASWIKKEPDDPDLLIAAANAYSQIGDRQRKRGAHDSSVTSAKRSLELRQRALELRPNRKTQRAVAVSYWAVASAEKAAGQAELAVADFKTTVEFLRRLADADPGNAQARRELLSASWLLASSLQDLLTQQEKRLEPTVPLWEDALRSGLQLLKEDPGNSLVEADVTLISLGLANTLEELHRPQAALDVLVPAISRQQAGYKSHPDNRAAGSYLAIMQILAADCYRDLGRLPQALSYAPAAMAILDTLLGTNPNSVEYQFGRVAAFRSLGSILADQGDTEGATSLYHKGLEAANKMPQGPSMYDPAKEVAEMKAAELRLASKRKK
jgi:tetratricopeptide (TPR) repeat protein